MIIGSPGVLWSEGLLLEHGLKQQLALPRLEVMTADSILWVDRL